MTLIKVSVQAVLRDLESWVMLARKLESESFEALLIADHPGTAIALAGARSGRSRDEQAQARHLRAASRRSRPVARDG